MARTLYLPDGTTEVIFNDPEETLRRIIKERLGQDCEELFNELLEKERHPMGGADNFKRIADGYLSLLQTTMDEVGSLLKEVNVSRIDKPKLRRHIQNIWDNLYKNL